MIQVMVGANDPVRGPHTFRASEQAQEIQGGMVGKEERSADARCWRSQTSDPRRPALKTLPNLSLNVSDTLRATRAEAALRATIWNLRHATNIHGDFVSHVSNNSKIQL